MVCRADGVPVVDSQGIVCTGSMGSLYGLYKEYAPLWDFSAPHTVCGIRSQMAPCAWRDMLCGGQNSVFGAGEMDSDAHFLLDGVLHGFK